MNPPLAFHGLIAHYLTFLFLNWKNNIRILGYPRLIAAWFRYFVSDTMFIGSLMISNRYKYIVWIYWGGGSWNELNTVIFGMLAKIIILWRTATIPDNYEFRTWSEEFLFDKMTNVSNTEWLSRIETSSWWNEIIYFICCFSNWICIDFDICYITNEVILSSGNLLFCALVISKFKNFYYWYVFV